MNSCPKSFKINNVTGLVFEPQEKPNAIVFLLHGYQGDSLSNAPFGLKLFENLKNTIVVIPDGLEVVPNQLDKNKRQWWNLIHFDGELCAFMPSLAPKETQKILHQMTQETHKTAALLNAFVLKTIQSYHLNLAQTFLVGISQGGITALDMTLFHNTLQTQKLKNQKQNNTLAGLITIGAGILGADELKVFEPNAFFPLPVLLLRGKYDEIFPKTVDYFSKSQLEWLGLKPQIKEVDSGHYGLEHHCIHHIKDFILSKI